MQNFNSWVNSLLIFNTLFIFFLCSCNTPAENSDNDDNDFVPIFDGKTLTDWEGDPTYWRVENGNLVGEITPATLLDRNSFIIWRGGVTSDFELKVEFRVSDKGNSGINYRSEEVKDVPFALRGYQADIDGEKRYTGMNYEERGRTVLAWPGQKVLLEPVDKDSVQALIHNNQWTASILKGTLGDLDSLKANIKNEDWNKAHLIVKGNHLKHYVNGQLMSDVTDNDTINRKQTGLLGVQVHVGPPMKIEYRNFRLKHLN
ncbi:DUF1080 domain-containing protein [soil metagenome]